MIFMLTYQIDRDKQVECQTFFTQMTDEQIAGEYPEGVKQIGRWHDVPNGNGVTTATCNLQTVHSTANTGCYGSLVSSLEGGLIEMTDQFALMQICGSAALPEISDAEI